MKTLFVLAVTMVCASVQAQTIYRCGSSYSQTPCAQGRVVPVNDERDVQQQQAALEVAARERALGEAMEQDRLTLEAQQRPSGAGKINGRVGHADQWRDAPVAKARSRKSPTKPHPHRAADRYRAVTTAGV